MIINPSLKYAKPENIVKTAARKRRKFPNWKKIFKFEAYANNKKPKEKNCTAVLSFPILLTGSFSPKPDKNSRRPEINNSLKIIINAAIKNNPVMIFIFINISNTDVVSNLSAIGSINCPIGVVLSSLLAI